MIPRRAQEEQRSAIKAAETGHWIEARIHVVKALASCSSYAAALALLGLIDMHQGDLSSAEKELKLAISNDPQLSSAYVNLASVYSSRKQYLLAQQVLSVLPSLGPLTWNAHYEIARAYQGAGAYDAALDEINHALAIASDDPPILHLAKAHVLLALKRQQDALFELKMTLRRDDQGTYAEQVRAAASALTEGRQ
jgi:tetratricopeptide (TPR) repeat protein